MTTRIPHNEHGHKRCATCGQYKLQASFGKDAHSWDGLLRHCKECIRARTAANKERKREYDRQRNIANPERNRARVKRWQEENRDQYLATLRNHYRNNRERHLARCKEYRRTNPDIHRASEMRRKARKLGNGGKFTAAEWQVLKTKYNHTCLCCGRCEPTIKLTPDHIMPLARGGSNAIENIQPLCVNCNSSKSDKHATDYRRLVTWQNLTLWQ